MNIFVFGTRGFPDIQGGVEVHCYHLYSILAKRDHSITIFRRKPYISKITSKINNISFIDLPSTKIVGFEAFYHSFLSTILCIMKRPDIIHIHNFGPGFFSPLLKIFGLKVVLTYHSPNYEHSKWSWIAKKFLKFAEKISINFSDKVIFVSKFQKEKFGSDPKFIHINNGVILPDMSNMDDYIRNLGLENRLYILAVGRFVEEKGFDLLIEAFNDSQVKDIKLVIAGDSDHRTNYSKKLKESGKFPNIVFPGYVIGEKLHQLYSHTRLFVLPSYHEGLPLSLLEALSYKLPVLVSDIPANKQLSLPKDRYFITGNKESLIKGLKQELECDFKPFNYNMEPYNWNTIALQTETVYEQVVN